MSKEYVEIFNSEAGSRITWPSSHCTSCLQPPSSSGCVLPSALPLTSLECRKGLDLGTAGLLET